MLRAHLRFVPEPGAAKRPRGDGATQPIRTARSGVARWRVAAALDLDGAAHAAGAAGGATVEVRRRTYEMGAPDFLNWPEARHIVRANFPVARGAFKILGIKQFMQAPVLDR